MRILVISDKLYPDEYGGSCTVAYKLIEEWQKNNIVDVFTCQKTSTSNDALFKNNIYRLFKKKNPIISAHNLNNILRKNDFDIIITHSVYSWLIYYLSRIFYKTKKNNKVFSIFHGPWHKEAVLKYEGKHNYIKQNFIPPVMLLIEKLYCRKNDNFIFLSKYMQEELAKIDYTIKNKNCYFIPGGVDINAFNREYTKNIAKSLIGIKPNIRVLFTLRRLEKRMGIDNLIEAIKLMNDKERDDYILLIGGKGTYKQYLEKKAQSISKNIRFLGFIPDNELNKYFCATDLFIVPTLDLEGFGLVNLESLAMGVPVLSTPQGGMVELAKEFDNLHLCTSNTIKGLKDGIETYTVLSNNIIYEKNLHNYAWKEIAKKYINIFKDVI